ncbi:MAG: NAD(P)-dependent oxidoreductase [Candidatus Theseobacter exili]|nr:NAD(P)-dependent oxidoreductase [Candidatus Theseobacter exili]
MDVFFYEAFEEERIALSKHLPDSIKCGFTRKTIQENNKYQDPPASIISIRTQSEIPDSWAQKISAILTRSTGYDHIIKYLNRNGEIPSGYLPLYCCRSVAEQAMLYWMALLRKLPQQINNFSSFQRDGLTGNECIGKTLLVVGVGNIGIEVVRLGQMMGMNVFGIDIVKKHDSVSYVPFEEGIQSADVIVCAMNLTEKNIGYFNYDCFKEAKPNSIFINIARGEFSPVADLLQLMKENRLGGIALDVFNKESSLAVLLRSRNNNHNEEIESLIELGKYSNVILTPHNAFNTFESVDRKVAQSIEQLTHFINNGSFLWPVPNS